MKFRHPIDFGADGLAHFHEEHLNLELCPAEAVAERPPRQAHETEHDDVAQDVATLLQPGLLGPRPNGTLQALALHVLEAGGRQLGLGMHDAMQVAAQRSQAIAEIASEVAPGVGPITRVVVAGRDVLKFLDFDVPAGFEMSGREKRSDGGQRQTPRQGGKEKVRGELSRRSLTCRCGPRALHGLEWSGGRAVYG